MKGKKFLLNANCRSWLEIAAFVNWHFSEPWVLAWGGGGAGGRWDNYPSVLTCYGQNSKKDDHFSCFILLSSKSMAGPFLYGSPQTFTTCGNAGAVDWLGHKRAQIVMHFLREAMQWTTEEKDAGRREGCGAGSVGAPSLAGQGHVYGLPNALEFIATSFLKALFCSIPSSFTSYLF